MTEQPVVVFQFKCFILPLSKNKKKYMKEQFLFSKKKRQKMLPLDIMLERKLSLLVRSIIIASFVRS